jgi:hypothetical protein
MKAALISLIIAVLVGASFIVMVRANPHIGPVDPAFTIHSPRYSMNQTSSIMLNFTIEVVGDWDYINCSRQAQYSLDGQGNNSVPLTYIGQEKVMGYPSSLVFGSTTLPDLTGFQHTIELYTKYNYGNYTLNGHRSFTFYTGMPPGMPSYTPFPYNQGNRNLLLGALIILAIVASISLVLFVGYRRHNHLKKLTSKQSF